ncbi:MAG TPA: glycosyltransferase family 2 protein [Bryobacteraceae bacterium]|jgi:glycosyltransferase involved in cell wall biosynthesis|nr:glycosyltransferase family 2 protein [Bryobacteraceae bacterium]
MTPKSRPPLSVLLPVWNCETTIRATLASVSWAEELLVVDSFSTDATLTICREYGARILQHEYVNSATQKNWAVGQCRYDWVLQIDSDEVIPPDLRDEIEKAVADAPLHTGAFRMPRRNHFLGRWMHHGGVYPDYQIRLFRRDAGRWADREVHSHLEMRGGGGSEIGTLRNAILHNDAPTLSRRFRDLDRYTRYEATELRKKGTPFRWYDLLLRPWAGFLYRYVWLGGYRDGWRGLIYCSYYPIYIFLVRAKLWEIEETKRTGQL